MTEYPAVLMWALVLGTSSFLLGVAVGALILRYGTDSKVTIKQYLFGSPIFAIPACWIAVMVSWQYAMRMGGSAAQGTAAANCYILHAGHIDTEVSRDVWTRVLLAEYTGQVALFWLVISVAILCLGPAIARRRPGFFGRKR